MNGRSWFARSCGALLFSVMPALVSGCFTQNVAEGRYVEAESSGRLLEFVDPYRPPGLPVDTIHLMRLNIVSFDEEAGGIVELFESRSYESFSREPSIMTETRPGYFCTRIEQASARNDVLTFRFVDWLNRSWLFSGRVVESGDLIEARLERLTASGAVAEHDSEAGLALLMEADELYFREGGAPQRQVVLERIDDAVGDDALDCLEYRRRDELVLELPRDEPLRSIPREQGRLRAALVLTRAATRPSEEMPLAGLNHREVLTASLDLDVDVLDGERRLLVRLPPEERYMVDIGEGLALGTIVVYIDRPEGSDPPDDRWDPIAYSPDVAEEVVAYAPTHVVVYSEDTTEVQKPAKDATGARVDVPLFADGRNRGWASYRVVDSDPVELPGGQRVRLVRQLEDPGPVIELAPVAAQCQLCYPVPQNIAGAGAVDPSVCASCPSILPLLFL